MSLNNRSILWWLLLLATVPSFASLLRQGFFPMHDDLPVFRQYALEECVRDGQIPCRWTKELGYGYGYPLMNFYPPLPYVVGLIPRAVGLSFLDTTKLLFILGLVVSAGFMARLGSLFFDHWGAVAGALLYLYGPYHALDLYVRGDLNELWAMAFFPVALWAGYKIVRKPSFHNALVMGGAYAGIVLSHVGMAFIMTPVLALWISVWLVVQGFRHLRERLFWLSFSGIFATALSAFFILPVIFEQKLVHVETLVMGYFNYLAHFVDLNQLFFSRFWGYGASSYGPGDGMSFQIGILHWTIGLIGLIGLIGWWKKKKPLATAFIFFFILFWASAFLAHWKATPLWVRIPKLEYLQFPWRFLALILPAVSFMATAAVSLVADKLKPFFVALLLLLLLLLYGSYFQPREWWYDRTDPAQFSGKPWQRAITAGIFDYLPKWSKMPPASSPVGDVQATPLLVARTVKKSSNYQEYSVANMSSSPKFLQVNTLYYPGWVATVGGREVPIGIPKGDLGIMQVSVPPGESKVALRFTETPLRRTSDIISLIAWSIFTIYLVKSAGIGRVRDG